MEHLQMWLGRSSLLSTLFLLFDVLFLWAAIKLTITQKRADIPSDDLPTLCWDLNLF